MPHVVVHTPVSEALSAGLVCFTVAGRAPDAVVKHLHERRIIASVTPYATEYVRLSPGILNTPEEVEAVLREIRALA
jgi:isopenicillin-N epimerase